MNEPLNDALAAIDELTQESDPLIRAKCRALLAGYDATWKNVEWETESVETEYHLPLVNPETGATSRTFTHAGKFDGIVKYKPSGKRYVLEHKCVVGGSRIGIEDPNSPYWRILTIESQVSGYMLATWQLGDKVDGTLYDVIRKPSIRPKAISAKDQKEIIQTGTYCGFDVPKPWRLVEGKPISHESMNLGMYEFRLLRECLDEPQKYFQRRPIPRMDSDLLEHATEMWEIGQAILDARNKNRHFKNHRSCFTYNSPCEYLPLCCGVDTEESDKWERVESVHTELPLLNGDGRSVLTNSRIGTFQTCRRKAFYRYEKGLRRVQEEDREALFFGTVFHEALAAYWRNFGVTKKS